MSVLVPDPMNIHEQMHKRAVSADTLSVIQIFLGPRRLLDPSAGTSVLESPSPDFPATAQPAEVAFRSSFHHQSGAKTRHTH